MDADAHARRDLGQNPYLVHWYGSCPNARGCRLTRS
jgi:hypothetical protein